MSFADLPLWLQLAGFVGALGVVYGGIRAEVRYIARRVQRLEDRLDRDSRIMAYASHAVRDAVRESVTGALDSRPHR